MSGPCCTACGRGCGGCGLPQQLGEAERRLLESFALRPFQPLLRREDGGRLHLPEGGSGDDEALLLLLRRGLLRADGELRLDNYPYRAPAGWLCGSAALTARGQEALDDMEVLG